MTHKFTRRILRAAVFLAPRLHHWRVRTPSIGTQIFFGRQVLNRLRHRCRLCWRRYSTDSSVNTTAQIPQFDTTLGTLNSVLIEYSWFLTSRARVHNDDPDFPHDFQDALITIPVVITGPDSTPVNAIGTCVPRDGQLDPARPFSVRSKTRLVRCQTL